MAGLRFDQINLVVPDVAAASRFLRALGVGVDEPTGDWADWVAHHVGIDTGADGGTFVADLDSSAFATYWGGLPEGFSGAVISLRADDRAGVDEAFALACTLGADVLREPHDAFFGARFAVVRGPGPIVVGLMSPSDPAYRSAGPSVSDFA